MSERPVDKAGANEPRPGQLQLEISEPVGRAYRSSAPPPRAPGRTSVWFARATSAGAFASVALIVYLGVFTDPGRSENVLSMLAALGFATLFAAWSLGYWARASRMPAPAAFPTWTITRQAILLAAGMEALAVLTLSRMTHLGTIVLVALVVTAAELLLRRMNLRP